MTAPTLQDVVNHSGYSVWLETRHDSILCFDLNVYPGTLEQAYEELKSFAGEKDAEWGWVYRIGYGDRLENKIGVRLTENLLAGMTSPVTDELEFTLALEHTHARRKRDALRGELKDIAHGLRTGWHRVGQRPDGSKFEYSTMTAAAAIDRVIRELVK